MSAAKKWPGETTEAHPDIFTTIPPQPTEKKDGQLTQKQLQQYFEEGYVLIDNFFKPEELQPVREAVKGLVDGLADRLHAAGKIKNLYREYGLFQRLTMLEKEFPGANILLHKLGKLPQAFRDLWSNERLLNAVEQLIGPDIAGHPVWNLRTKTPQSEATTVPWHQDVGYLDNDSYQVMQPAAWIPLLDSNETNGCMQMVHKGHKTGKVARHQGCWGDTWYVWVDEDEMEKTLDVNVKEDTVTCEVPYGGVLFLNNIIPHRSLNNLSNDVRWSLDLRWQNPDKPVGFHGIRKKGILMRSSTDPNVHIDWETADKKDRIFSAEQKSIPSNWRSMVGADTQSKNEWDTTIQGPWMKKWELTHHNRHTAKLTEVDMTIYPWT